MGKFLQKPSPRETQFWFKWWLELLLTLLKEVLQHPQLLLKEEFAEREGRGATTVPINVLPGGEIDHPIWKLNTKKYLPAFNTGGSFKGALDISLPV